jgi:PAS domain S-box-containing protein
MFVDDLLAILTAFGGGRGGEPNDAAVRFLLPTFFWGSLAVIALRCWLRHGQRKDLYIAAAACVGIGRELLMFAAEFGGLRGRVDFDALYPIYPPLEHSAVLLSYAFVGAAFLAYLAPENRSARTLLLCGSALAGSLYIVTALSWPVFLRTHPRAPFGSFWGDMLFRCAAASLLLALFFLLDRQRRIGRYVPGTCLAASLLFFLDEFLMICNLAGGELHVAVYAPIRHNLHIWAIPLLVSVYWEAQAHFLRESEARFRELADLLPQPVFEMDPCGNITFGNGQAFSVFGYEPDELSRGLNAIAMIVPEDRNRAKENTGAVLGGARSRGEEYTVMRRDGSTFPVVIYSAPIVRRGETVGLRGIIIDVSERRRTEEHLRKLSTVVEQSPVAIVITDTAGSIEYANPRYARLTGYAREEVVGESLPFLRPGAVSRAECRQLWETIGAGREWEGEYEGRKKDGEGYRARVIVAPVKDADGTITHYVCIKEDITAARQAEEERARLEGQLLHAQKMEAIGQLAGGIAHDFNNLLTAIIGYGKLLEMGMAEDDPGRHHMEQILHAADRAAMVTHGLLAFSRKQAISPAPIDLNGIVVSVEKILARLIGEDIELSTLLHGDVLTVMADPGQIDQVVINLATNARDAMPAGGRLAIVTRRAEVAAHSRRPEHYAVLEVSDSGAGMDAATLARACEPFFTTKETGKGTGLGLAIVYGIVKQHNGFIDIRSAPGEGTAVNIHLPLIYEEFRASPSETGSPAVLRGNETVLIAEDHMLVRELSRIILEDFGYGVIEAEDGEEAVTKFYEHRDEVALVLMDVVLPKKNGEEALAEMRRLRPDVKVLFTSGYADDAILSRGIHLTGDKYLRKPVSPETLLRKVREALDS